jgi:hypothetical protein
MVSGKQALYSTCPTHVNLPMSYVLNEQTVTDGYACDAGCLATTRGRNVNGISTITYAVLDTMEGHTILPQQQTREVL